MQNRYLEFLTDPSFQRVNRLFALSFDNEEDRKSYKKYYLPTIILINGRNVFDQAVKNNLKTYDNIHKIASSQVNDYKTGCLLDCPCFTKYYKKVAIDLKK